MIRRLTTSVIASFGHRHFSQATPGSPPYRVLFFGTDNVSLATLKMLYANCKHVIGSDGLIEHIEVVCPSNRPMNGSKKAEPVPVKKFAQRRCIKTFDTPSNLKSLKTWDFPVSEKFDVGVVVSFGYFLHPHMLKNLYHGAINMHPSLLPKYRGPAPIHHALLNGDLITGVSIIEIVSEAFDAGRILLQKPYEIKPGIQYRDLADELAAFGSECVLKTLASLQTMKEKAVVQDDARASKAPKLKFKDGLISFKETARDIFHRWQALSNSVGVNVYFRGNVVKLVEIQLPMDQELDFVKADEARNGVAAIGTFFFEKNRQVIWLRCENFSWLKVLSLQQAGRKVGTALDFCNGIRLKNMQRELFEQVPMDRFEVVNHL
ncbi:putative methionyl-tRNA formyltransferase, formyl transferase-like domain superfamily [Plasmopara halstedii]